MFILQRKNFKELVKKGICFTVLGLFLLSGILGFGTESPVQASKFETSGTNEVLPQDIIRFHVIANSDSEEDQLLKYAVRDAILKKAAPTLAQSVSLAESRAILLAMEDDLTAPPKM
jgi:stage II sporulation protein R